MDRAREQLLARAALTDDEDGRVRCGDAVDHREQLAHQRRLADHLAETAGPLDLAAQAPHFPRQRTMGDGALHDRSHLDRIARLREDVERACAHRPYGELDRRPCAPDHGDAVRRDRPDPVQQREGVVLVGRELRVEQDQVERRGRDPLERRAHGGRDLEVHASERHAREARGAGIGIDHQHVTDSAHRALV